ncbi:hypothetical protein [Streptomyces smaragdinus]|uniref:hypothetical protein n=1 Tax=Streptomyces smaragdinus TaxID=2585196 RepID=UPI0012948BE8|nr:hypothetical protein [Streptomyces smaragdinus]
MFLAVDLPPDLPEPVLLELRWLLGQGDRPAELMSADWESWGDAWEAFAGDPETQRFDGMVRHEDGFDVVDVRPVGQPMPSR